MTIKTQTIMKIKWINHASFLIKYDDISLISDPWIEGRVFNNSWEHLLSSGFDYDGFKEITHIWFSHEHPDHFYPPNISKIPPEFRAQITVLFHETIDRKVVDFCKKSGFKEIIELRDWRKYELAKQFEITCSRVENDTDSWLFMTVGDTHILNLNDCIFSSDKKLIAIKNKFPKIDLLLTQFSYANWCGNPNDKAQREFKAKLKVDEVLYRLELFDPTFFIPFASYVWFCHEDNFFMNDSVNKVSYINKIVNDQSNVRVLIFKPNDFLSWDDRYEWDSSNAIKAYEKAFDNLKFRVLSKSTQVPEEVLLGVAEKYRERLLKFHGRSKLVKMSPMKLHIRDYNQSYSFDFLNGLRKSEAREKECDIALKSDVLVYTFNLNWGFDTLLVSGLFHQPSSGNFNRIRSYVFLSELLNKGEKIGGKWSSLKRIIKNRLK